MAFQATPGEVMQRFEDDEIVHLVAYQNLYGPITPRRLDILLARHAMDVLSPHLRRGKRTRLRDHLMTWSMADRPVRTGREMLGIVKALQERFDRNDDTPRRRRRKKSKEASDDGSR